MRSFLKPWLLVGVLLCIGVGIAVTACGEEQTLEGTKWVMTSYSAGGSMRDALPDVVVDATFTDGQVAGNGGINQYSGMYEHTGDRLTFPAPFATTMMVGEPVVMDQEYAYLAALQSAATYEIKDGILSISDASGATVLQYKPAGG